MVAVYTFGDSMLDCGHYNAFGINPGQLLVQNDDRLFPEFRGHDLTHPCPADLGVRRASLSQNSASTRWQAFFNTLLHSRKVIHVGVTQSPPTLGWRVPLREATAYGAGPKYLIRDHESKFGVTFARVAKTSHIEILKTPYYAPRANAICERFPGSVQRECLDQLLILHEQQLHRVLNAYVASFNQARSHQGIRQQIAEPKAGSVPADHTGRKVLSFPILGGLHRDYRRSA